MQNQNAMVDAKRNFIFNSQSLSVRWCHSHFCIKCAFKAEGKSLCLPIDSVNIDATAVFYGGGETRNFDKIDAVIADVNWGNMVDGTNG